MINPPSGVTAANYWNAIKAGKPTHVRITFLGQDIVLTDEDIDVSTGITVNDVLNSDTDLVFGKAVCKQVSMQILNSDALAGLIWTGEFTLEFGVEMGSPAVTEWVTVGTFSGDKPKNVTTAQTIAFDAYDRMKRFDILADDYVKGISYPATLSTIYSGLCDFVGVSKEAGSELPTIMSRSFSSAPAEMAGYTCRDLLAWIAEACGCYAKINASGKVQMVWFADNTGHTVSADEEFSVETGDIHAGLTWDEADSFTWDEIETMTWNDVCGYEEAYSIDQILLKQLDNDLDINYPYPYGGNVYMIVDNPFLAVGSGSDITNYVKPIYDRLVAFGGYLPVSMDCIGNWCVEAGDLITISVQDNSISFPIFVKTMHWNGAVTDEYEATGQKDRAVYTSDKNRERVITNKEIKLYVDGNFYDVKSGIEIKEEGVEISGGKYVDIKSGSSFSVESGGSIDIHGSGTLSLEGSTVEIKSGSTFDVDSTNFKISSEDKKMVSGNTIFSDEGLTFIRNEHDVDLKCGMGLTGIIDRLEDTQGTTIRFDHYWQSVYQFFRGYVEFVFVDHNLAYKFLQIMDSDDDFQIMAGKRDHGSTHIDNFPIVFPYLTCSIDFIGQNIYYKYLIQNSSRDIKHNITDLPPVGEKLDQLRPVTFVYDDDETEKQRMGLIYEDTVEVMPEICTDNESHKAINYVELIPALLKEIQDLRARVKQLEER